MHRVVATGGVVPGIWWYELRNALMTNERRGPITMMQAGETLADCADLGVEIDDSHDEAALPGLARQYTLAAYEAAYLEVASRRRLPLATLDRRLSEAARAADGSVIDTHR